MNGGDKDRWPLSDGCAEVQRTLFLKTTVDKLCWQTIPRQTVLSALETMGRKQISKITFPFSLGAPTIISVWENLTWAASGDRAGGTHCLTEK